MAKTKENNRKIITNEEFLDYKRQLRSDEIELIKFTLILLKQHYGFSASEISELFDVPEEELFKELYDAYGIDYSQLSEQDFFSELSESKRQIFKELTQKIVSTVEVEELKEKIYNEELLEFDKTIYKQYTEEVEKEKNKIYEILSNSDLSQVLPESFFDCRFLDKINLQDSGAKLDMEKFDYGCTVTGSIKGCELISFSDKHYKDSLIPDRHINQECLDESQYIAVIKYFLLNNMMLSEKDKFLFEKQEIQDEIQWIFDKVLEEGENTAHFYLDLYKLMTPETRTKNEKYIEKTIELSITNNNRYSAEQCFEFMNQQQFDKYFSDILELYIDENGTVDFDKLISKFWRSCSSEIQLDKYAIFRSLIDERAKDENKNSYLMQLLRYSNEETQKQILSQYIEECRSNNGDLSLEKVRYVLEETKKNVDIPDKYFQEILSIFEEGNTYSRNPSTYEFIQIWIYMSTNSQKSHLISMLELENDLVFKQLWKGTDIKVQKEIYDELVAVIEEKYPSLEHEFKGSIYISMLQDMPEEEFLAELNDNIPKFINALREKYNNTDEQDIKDYSENYDLELAKILMQLEKSNDINDTNVNAILDNLPTFGKEIVYRVINSNSRVIQSETGKILSNLALNPENAEQLLSEIEDVFSQKNLPNFMKLYKYFELIQYDDKINFASSILSPVLLNTESKKLSKRIIFSDLMKISMDSNNKSLKNFVDTLEQGNELYIQVMINNIEIGKLSSEEKVKAREYIKTLYFLYEQSETSIRDKKEGKKITLTGDIRQDFEALGKRYSHNGCIKNLPDQILRTIVGPYQELFQGIDSVEKIKEYMEQKLKESNERHLELARKKIDLHTGDLVKGIVDGVRVFPSIVSDGVRAGEFLGIDHHSDATPLDADFSVILDRNNGENFLAKLNNTISSSYGDMFFVIKYDPNRMEYSRQNDDLGMQVQGNTMSQKIATRKEKETTSKRVNDRARGEYDTKKLEIFSSEALGGEHYGIRTGVGITDIDYIVLRHKYDKRLGYELAMNGTYIPIIDAETEKLLFSPEDYELIRSKMQGLAFYDTGDFIVDESAKTTEAQKIIDELFPTGNIDESISEKEAKSKRSAIQYQVAKSLYENMGIGLETHVTGNMTEGFVEFIDTGSTGRGTNVPGSGDFDFMMKVDKNIIGNSERMAEFKKHLIEVLAIRSDDPETSVQELGGNFRYKKVTVEGIKEPVDIDITFTPKSEELTYSTDMCVKDRLENLKKTDPEGYKYTIANIVLAKRLLKKEGLYKKSSSEGATIYGGFGGVGVENWILQNGGSLSMAINTFLRTAEESKSFDEFMEKYPIFDFGENHAAKGYQHDSFIRGLTKDGYEQMQVKLKEIQRNLTPIKDTPIETYLAETIIADSRRISR